MADLAAMLAQALGLREEPQPPQQRGPMFDPRVTAQLGRDFGGDAFGQMGRDFRAGFNNAAISARQAMPRRTINALSNLSIPGWQGMAQQRSMTDATQAGLQAPGQMLPQQGVSLSEALAGGYDAAAEPVTSPQMPPRRGLEPPSAPARSPYEMEDEAFRRARERARQALAGDPDPTGLRATTQIALEPYRASAEWDRRRLENRQSFTPPPISKRR